MMRLSLAFTVAAGPGAQMKRNAGAVSIAYQTIGGTAASKATNEGLTSLGWRG